MTEVTLFPKWNKSKNTSVVWDHYGFKKDDNGELDKTIVYCKYCLKGLGFTGGTTTHLIEHLKGLHPKVSMPAQNCCSNSTTCDPVKITWGSNNDDDGDNNESSTDGDSQKMNKKPKYDNIYLFRKVGNLPDDLSETLYSCVRKRKNDTPVSIVWKYFGFKKRKSGDLYKEACFCRLCSKAFIHCASGSTSNLLKHLTRIHHEQYKEEMREEGESDTESKSSALQDIAVPIVSDFSDEDDYTPLSTLDENPPPKKSRRRSSHSGNKTSTVTQNMVVKCESGRDKLISDTMVYLVAKNVVSLKLLHSADFCNLVSLLDPKYEHKDSDFFAEKLTDLYAFERNRIKQEINEINNSAFTIEQWSCKGKDYLSIEIHFISQSWKLSNSLLNTIQIADKKQATISESLQKVLCNWDLPESNMMAVIASNNHLRATLNEMNVQYIGCLGDILNHAVLSAIEKPEISQTVDNIRELCRLFHENTALTDVLKQICQQKFPNAVSKCNIPSPDVSTWWELYKMISDVHKLKRPLQDLLSHESDTYDLCTVTYEDWKVVNEVRQMLGSIYQIAESLRMEGNPLGSTIMPILYQLRDVTQTYDHDSELVVNMKCSIKDTLENTWSYQDDDMRNILFLATIIDPRFKSLWFLSQVEKSRVYQYFSEKVMELAYEDGHVESEITALAKKTKVEISYDSDDSDDDTPKGLASLFGMAEAPKVSKQTRTGPKAEVEQYKNEEQLAMNLDPIEWWQKRKDKYPTLSKLARTYLCVPACILRPDLMFTKAGEEVELKRMAIAHEENLDKIMFLNKIYRTQ